jgi:hypothetical protein
MGKGRVPSALRRRVRRRAKGRCEYCLHPHALSTGPFQCDHATPGSKGGATSLENLVWACGWCNLLKQDLASGWDRVTRTTVRLFNPRFDRWDEHFRWSRDLLRIFGKTPMGRVTVRVLQLNRRGTAAMRSALVRSELHPALKRR